MGMVATTTASKTNGTDTNRIKSYAPATGELLGEVPAMSADEVRAVVERARRAQASWAALPTEERCERMLRYRDALIARDDELTELLSREAGKPKMEALLHEIGPVATVITYFAKRAAEVLSPQEVPLMLMKHRRSYLHYVPRGVVGLITPWNYPILMPLRDAVIALIAGNAVVIKPSEITPLIAVRFKEVWDQAGLPPDLLQVVTGYGPTGAALIDAGIDFCVFTGAVATGKRVAAACGERLIPCVMELGGKAPLIVCADADVERAARAAVWGGFSNAGQICVSVERVYAHRDIADRLTSRIVELTQALRQGDPDKGDVDVGAIIFPKQIDIAEAHIEDATSKGGKLLCGGKRPEGGGQFFEPTVLGDCDHTMTVMTEEIFGPIVPIMRVESDEEALRLANQSHLGLNAYVFSRDREYAHRLAERVEAGSVLINDVLANGGSPETPFGGIKESGFGRTMSDDALRGFCNVRHINIDRIATSDEPIWYPYTDTRYNVARKALRVLFGGGGLFKKLSQLF